MTVVACKWVFNKQFERQDIEIIQNLSKVCQYA
jgi:hypothetical protein